MLHSDIKMAKILSNSTTENYWGDIHDDHFPAYGFEKWGVKYSSTVNKYWYYIFYVGIAYAAIVYALKTWMKNRPAYDLKNALVFWNCLLGVYSAASVIRAAPRVIGMIGEDNGLYKAFCLRNFNDVEVFWGLMFMFSKIVELGDTIFIVLRKRPLVFLQYFHHWLALTIVWLPGFWMEPTSRWFAGINCFVHSIMYPYFALKTAGVQVPRSIALVITCIQVSQMFLGFFINFASFYFKRTGHYCAREDFSIYLVFLNYVVFIYLFGNLLYKEIQRRQRQPAKNLKQE